MATLHATRCIATGKQQDLMAMNGELELKNNAQTVWLSQHRPELILYRKHKDKISQIEQFENQISALKKNENESNVKLDEQLQIISNLRSEIKTLKKANNELQNDKHEIEMEQSIVTKRSLEIENENIEQMNILKNEVRQLRKQKIALDKAKAKAIENASDLTQENKELKKRLKLLHEENELKSDETGTKHIEFDLQNQIDLISNKYASLSNVSLDGLIKMELKIHQIENEMNETNEVWTKYKNQISDTQKQLKNKLNPNIKQYKTWKMKQIQIWLHKLDNAKYAKYANQLIQYFTIAGVTAKDLPDLNRFNLKSWGVQQDDAKALEIHFKALQPQTDAIAEKEGTFTQFI
eukprot:529148_1